MLTCNVTGQLLNRKFCQMLRRAKNSQLLCTRYITEQKAGIVRLKGILIPQRMYLIQIKANI